MHGLSCCHGQHAGAHAASFHPGTVNLQEDPVGGEDFSDFPCFGGFHPKVLYNVYLFQLGSLML